MRVHQHDRAFAHFATAADAKLRGFEDEVFEQVRLEDASSFTIAPSPTSTRSNSMRPVVWKYVWRPMRAPSSRKYQRSSGVPCKASSTSGVTGNS
jgi:hypothetical protein